LDGHKHPDNYISHAMLRFAHKTTVYKSMTW